MTQALSEASARPVYADADRDNDGAASAELATEVVRKFLLLNRYLRQYARQMDDQGIRPVEFSVLHFLEENGPSTVGQVQEFLFRSASTTSTVLSRMEEAGYVTRVRSAEDNRVVIVELTTTGRELAQRARWAAFHCCAAACPGFPMLNYTFWMRAYRT